jgi:hypothetical protein
VVLTEPDLVEAERFELSGELDVALQRERRILITLRVEWGDECSESHR